MSNLVVVFLTGLTAGGLSCLLVQGGLLASSVGYQAVLNSYSSPLEPSYNANVKSRHELAWPILLFLGAKLIAYTLLGFLLGWLGSMFQLTPATQAVTQIVVGIFMLGMALNMLKVHPIFRYFVIEPPAFVTRYLRRTAKQGAQSAMTPLFLGALTVLIPCGVTQVVMASAIASGDPVVGASTMFAFTLGASPVFFALAYLATQLGKRLEARFIQVVALLVLVLSLVSIDAGLNLMGAPISVTRLRAWLTTPVPQTVETVSVPVMQDTSEPALPPGWKVYQSNEATPMTITPGLQSSGEVVVIQALNNGYAPDTVVVPADKPLQIQVVTNNTFSCTRAFTIPQLNINEILPESGVTSFDLPAQAAGTTLFYTCSMGMYSGLIRFGS